MTRHTPNANGGIVRPEVMVEGRERRTVSSTRRVVRLLEDGDQFGKYRVVRLIARGGMSEVYEVVHVGLKKPMALKVMLAQLAESPEARERFVKEGENTALVRHPNVVDVSDVGVIDELPYLVMELLDGESLGDAYLRTGPMPVCDVVDLLLPVAAAIQAAHEHGVIHRDLKPDNILLQYDGRRVVPKVLDFGASRVLRDPRITVNSSVLGTPHYMSPEQARGDAAADARTDQYALGVILYEAVTGCLPRDAEDPLGLLHKVAYDSFRPPSHHAELPEGLEPVILRAMAREPSQRFACMRDFAMALLPYASDGAREYWSVELAFPSGGRSPDIAMPLLAPRALTPPAALPPIHTDALAGGRSLSGGLDDGQTDALVTLPMSDFKSLPPPPQSEPPIMSHSATPFSDALDPLAAAKRETRRRIAYTAAVVAAVCLGVGAAVLVFTGKSSETDRAPHAVLDQKPEQYEIAVHVAPTTAELLLDGERIGAGHYSGRLPRNGRSHELRVTAEGFVPQSFTFRDAPPPSQITLTASAKAPSAPAATRSPSKTADRSTRSVRTSERSRPVATRKHDKSASTRSSETSPPPVAAVTEEAPAKVRVIKETAPKIQVIE